MQAALQQISKVERMVQLEQFSGARLQLREGSASTLRKDLRDAQEFSPQITDTVRRRGRMRHDLRCVRLNAHEHSMTVRCCSRGIGETSVSGSRATCVRHVEQRSSHLSGSALMP